MAPQLNHTIVYARDSRASSRFMAEVLGLPEPVTYGPFQEVQAANGVSLDFHDTDEEIASQHYAFLVSEDEFDQIWDRIRARDLTFWADPMASRPGEINTNDGGRGLYFQDPDGHVLEIITRPYGSGG